MDDIEKALKVINNDACYPNCFFPKRRNCRSCEKQCKAMIKKYIKNSIPTQKIQDKINKLKKMKEKAGISGAVYDLKDGFKLRIQALEELLKEENYE